MNQKELEDLIVYHQNLYYNSVPEIEDWEFDQFWDELAANYPDSELLNKVGDEGKIDSEKAEHIIHMGSQEKVNTADGLEEWIRLKKVEFPILAQPKYDGLSVELVYDNNGKFVRAVSRGNGKVGKIISNNVLKMSNVPKYVNIPAGNEGELAVRGEIILPLDNVCKLVGFEEIKNVRNIASGIANQKNTTSNLELLEIICYDCTIAKNEISKIEFLSKNNFTVPSVDKICNNFQDMLKFIDGMDGLRKALRYQTDGIVFKQINTPKDADFSKARPDWQRAFKFPVEKVTTKLVDVEWSRNGFNFTPVAILNPIEILDTIVSRASLANYDEVKRLGIKVPCIVQVAKQNEIIPKVHSVISCERESMPAKPPTVCPICGKELLVTGTSVKCVNQSCPTHNEHRLIKWINTIGALGFGESAIEYLIYECNIEHISDLYCNRIVANAIENCSFKKRLAKAFADLWERSRNINLWDFIGGFDIEGLGSRVIKLIVDAGYNTLDSLRQVNYDSLLNIQGFGEARAKIFVEQIGMLEDEINAVMNTKRVTIKEPEVINNNISGLTFVITGALSKPRKFYEELINSNNCKIGSSVTKTTSYLVTDNPNSGSSKNKKAAELGIPIINEEQFMSFFNL